MPGQPCYTWNRTPLLLQDCHICAQAILAGELAGVDGYVLDLRNNAGGVFEDSIAIASYFLDSDGSDTHIVETVRNNDAASRKNIIDNVWKVGLLPSDVFPKHGWGLTARPMAVLTNGGTASAAEVLTGALKVRRTVRQHVFRV